MLSSPTYIVEFSWYGEVLSQLWTSSLCDLLLIWGKYALLQNQIVLQNQSIKYGNPPQQKGHAKCFI
jgi:hypothetical protein